MSRGHRKHPPVDDRVIGPSVECGRPASLFAMANLSQVRCECGRHRTWWHPDDRGAIRAWNTNQRDKTLRRAAAKLPVDR